MSGAERPRTAGGDIPRPACSRNGTRSPGSPGIEGRARRALTMDCARDPMGNRLDRDFRNRHNSDLFVFKDWVENN